MKGKILYGIIGILGAITAIIPLTVYHFIEMAGSHEHMAMACHTANGVATVVGVVIVSVVIIMMFFRKTNNAVVPVLPLTGGIAVCAVPRIFRLCASMDMACRYLTKPTLTLLGSAIIILSLVLLVRQVVSGRKGSIVQ